ncbi:hypothetical protein [Corynebacterium ureicelerivorans]|nr:hypothetical protein [Corynebacterium ureicelerivorans]
MNDGVPKAEIARRLKVGRTTPYSYVKRNKPPSA